MIDDNGGVLYRYAKPNAITSDSEAQGYPVINSLELNPLYIYRSIGGNVIINFSYLEAVCLAGIGFINHTFDSEASIVFRILNDLQEIISEISIEWAEKNIYRIFSETQKFKNFQLEITSVAAFQIGVLFPALIFFQFPENYIIQRKHSFRVMKKVESTDFGIHYESPDPEENENDESPPEWETLGITFKNSDPQNLSLFYPLLRPGKKILIPAPSENNCFFGIIPNTSIDATRNLGEDQYSLDFWECASLPGGNYD